MLKFYNTLSRKKEAFKPRKSKKVNFFVCGPTVYDFAHIGHARTYIIFDAIVKYLKYKKFKVFYLQNITDVDDKIINRAKEKNIRSEELAKEFERSYFEDMEILEVNNVSKYAKATEYIKEIISQVERLLKKGFAYQLEDGIYYNVSKFKNYGKLAKRTILQAEDGVSRIDEGINKKNKGDFCLWKFSKPDEPKWPSPWGEGRPGWHIEDTAISEKYFGPQYDIHGGAKDLIFPHHEAEIAQIEAISDKKPFVKYWLHTGFLTVNGQKMSKSLNNFITIKDFLKDNPARILRFLIIKNHYRSPIDYTEKMILQSKKELERMDEFIDKIQNPKSKIPARIATQSVAGGQNKAKFKISKYEESFNKALEDDFNTPKAVAVIFDLINKGNALIAGNKLTKTDSKSILKFLQDIDSFFGFIFTEKEKQKIPKEILALVKERETYRQQKNWQKADEMRKKISDLGYQIKDTAESFKIKKID